MSGQDQSPQGLWVDTVCRSGRLLAAAPCVPCSSGRHSICWGDLNAVCPCPACTEWSKRSPFGHPPDDCACGRPAAETVAGQPCCGDDR